MNPEPIEYGGWPNCLRLTNGLIELVVTLDVGPRIIRLGFVDGQNLFANFEDQLGKTGGDEWFSFGGHRLWHAPEVEPRTYFPDNRPVAQAWDGKTLTLTPPPEESNRLQLSLAITLDPAAPQVTVDHRITNLGVWDTELAPWCLSVMAPGGHAVIPQEKFVAHGETFLPARPLVVWPFTNMADPRFTWGEAFIQMAQDDRRPSKQKIGAGNQPGWAAYALDGELFVKRFGFIEGATYPDMGCNCEFFTMPEFLEVETLGPLTRLAPGASVDQQEQWGLYRAEIGTDEAQFAHRLLPHVEATPAVTG